MSKRSKKSQHKHQTALYRKALTESEQGVKGNRSFLRTLVILVVLVALVVFIGLYNAHLYYQGLNHDLSSSQTSQVIISHYHLEFV